jgi:hypothetical protein
VTAAQFNLYVETMRQLRLSVTNEDLAAARKEGMKQAKNE